MKNLILVISILFGLQAGEVVDTTVKVASAEVEKKDSVAIDTAEVATMKSGISLTTVPTEATVIVGGESYTTPADIALVEGTHTLEIRKSGFYAKKVKVAIPADSVLSETITLRAPGKLILSSTPDSSRVLVNKMPVGYTPYNSKPMKPGKYEVIVVKTGFVTYRDSVEIQSGEEKSLSLELASKNPQPIKESVGPADGSSQKPLTAVERKAANTNSGALKKSEVTPEEDSEKTKRVTRIIAGGLFAAFLIMITSFELSDVGE